MIEIRNTDSGYQPIAMQPPNARYRSLGIAGSGSERFAATACHGIDGPGRGRSSALFSRHFVGNGEQQELVLYFRFTQQSPELRQRSSVFP
jgi:hypothetical protein